MLVEYAVPIIPTMEGPKEQTWRPCDTETRLSLEQALDLGDAELTNIIEVEGAMEMGTARVTHRLVTSTGGVFHVRMVEGERQWPRIGLPDSFGILEALLRDAKGMVLQMQTQVLALELLEAEVKELREIREALEEASEC